MSGAHGGHLSAPGERRLGELGSRAMSVASIVGAVGLLLSVVSAAAAGAGWERFFRSYLMAFMFVTSICLGALFFVMLQHATRAGWSVVIRRLAEGVASNLMCIWVLFIPVVIGMFTGHLYDWTEVAATSDDPKYIYWLAPAPWLIRAAIYFGAWALLARYFVGNSIAQDADGDAQRTRRLEKFALPAIILYFVTQGFSAIDWVMSLEHMWFSTMFPVYFFAASCCGYFALQILLMYFVQRKGRLLNEITIEHYQDAGKLLFAFGIVFWAYIAYSQYMLIWYANLPEETPWYMARQMGGWGAVTLLLLFGHFLGPFLILISRHPKRRRGMLAAAATWMVLIHAIDIYWLVMPQAPHVLHFSGEHPMSYTEVASAVANHHGVEAQQLAQRIPKLNVEEDFESGYGWHLLDLTCLIGLASLMLAGAAWRLGGVSLLPERDPRLHESLAFENM